MPKRSAGLVMYRYREGQIEVLLVHPGGPYWAKRDEGAWTIPKGEIEPGEDALAAARREFEEETGLRAEGEMIPLGEIRHKAGKVVTAWGFAGDCNPQEIRSNTFLMEWPPRSGKRQRYPEVDGAEFYPLDSAKQKIILNEFELLQNLADHLAKRR